MLASLTTGHYGTKIHASDDAGRSWHEVATPAYSMQPDDAQGPPWQLVESVPVSNFGFAVAVHPHDADTAWFVPAEADQRRVPVGTAIAVNRTCDGGRTFETFRDGLPQLHAYDLVYRHGLAVADDGRRLLMGSTAGSLWASVDAGEHWRAVSQNLPRIFAVRFG